MISTYIFRNSLGSFQIELENELVKSISIDVNDSFPSLPESHLLTEKLNQYFTGISQTLDFQIDPEGTAFQKNVWAELQKIPYGETRTYGEIAKILGMNKGARAIGLACGANPILFKIPCHRVISATGIGGFSAGISLKEKLLELEGSR